MPEPDWERLRAVVTGAVRSRWSADRRWWSMEDVVQDVMLTLIQAHKDGKRPEHWNAYAVTMARWRVQDMHRVIKRSNAHECNALVEGPVRSDKDIRDIESRENIEYICRGLNESYRAIAQSLIEGREGVELSKHHGVCRATVLRARGKIRRALEAARGQSYA